MELLVRRFVVRFLEVDESSDLVSLSFQTFHVMHGQGWNLDVYAADLGVLWPLVVRDDVDMVKESIERVPRVLTAEHDCSLMTILEHGLNLLLQILVGDGDAVEFRISAPETAVRARIRAVVRRVDGGKQNDPVSIYPCLDTARGLIQFLPELDVVEITVQQNCDVLQAQALDKLVL